LIDSPTAGTQTLDPVPIDARMRDSAGVRVAAWVAQLQSPTAEPAHHSRRMARVRGLAAIFAPLACLSWRIAFTLPVDGSNRAVALLLVMFEALPLTGLVLKTVTL
jgi:HEAT repeat protein